MLRSLPSSCLIALLSLTACSGEGGDGGDGLDGADGGDSPPLGGQPCVDGTDPNAPFELIDTNLSGDQFWSCDRVWILGEDKLVYVTDGTLTVEKGTTVKGLTGSALVIEKTAKLESIGTPDEPIVYTSAQQDPARGDWGGLVLLGTAVNNWQGGVGFADGILDPPTYGGSNDDHDCGTIQYTRVEWAGYELRKDDELNGISVYSCGRQSTFDHIQVHMGQDDGFEAYGGIFDVNYLVVTGAADDSIDTDAGNRSTFQYALIQHDPLAGDNGLELSGNGSDFSATPYAETVVCNATVIGAGPDGRDRSKGFAFKEGAAPAVDASIFTHATQHGGVLTHPETQDRAEAGQVTVTNSIFWDNSDVPFETGVDDNPFAEGTDPGWDAAAFEAFVLDDANGNRVVDPGLGSVAWGAPDAMPGAVVKETGGATHPNCEPTDFVGAVDPDGEDWTQASWIKYLPE